MQKKDGGPILILGKQIFLYHKVKMYLEFKILNVDLVLPYLPLLVKQSEYFINKTLKIWN